MFSHPNSPSLHYPAHSIHPCSTDIVLQKVRICYNSTIRARHWSLRHPRPFPNLPYTIAPAKPMTFLSPTWLLALIPFAAFSLWLLVGRRRRQWVPFLELWNAPEELRRPKKGFEPPPISLVLALLAILLGLLAMSQPQLWPAGGARDRGRITLIVDRGASMSARIDGKPRFAKLAGEVAPRLVEALELGSVDLIDITTGQVQRTDRSDWLGLVQQWKRTALDTQQQLKTSVQQRLERGAPVIVLSDQDLGITHPQLVQIKPEQPVQNAAIVALSNRPGQVMLTLHSTSALTRTLHAQSGDRTAQRTVDLKPGVDQNVFLDLDAAADTIEAWFDQSDDFDADDRAWLVRRQSWPIVEARTALPDELRRMFEIYSRHRPSSRASPRVAVTRPEDAKPDEPGVLLPLAEPPELPYGEVGTRTHPLLAGVDWSALTKGVALAKPPGQGWTKLAWLGAHPIVAVREGEVRQVWIGFESREFARTPAFVVFWTNVFDWTGGGTQEFQASPITQGSATKERLAPEKLSDDIDPTLWPGVFNTPNGKLALNTGPVRFAARASDAVARLPALSLNGATGVNLAPWLALAALVCLLGAAATWEKRRTRARRPHLDASTEQTPSA